MDNWIKMKLGEFVLRRVEQVSLGDSGANNTFITYIFLTVGTILFYTVSTFFLSEYWLFLGPRWLAILVTLHLLRG